MTKTPKQIAELNFEAYGDVPQSASYILAKAYLKLEKQNAVMREALEYYHEHGSSLRATRALDESDRILANHDS